MKKKILAGIGATVLVCSIGTIQTFAFGGFSNSNGTASQDRPRFEMTGEMQTAFEQRDEKLNSFLQTLTVEQKALYEAAMPQLTRNEIGQKSVKPDETVFSEIKEKQEAFIASLTEIQKTTYDELFGMTRLGYGEPTNKSGIMGRQNRELTDEEKAQIETAQAQREEKLSSFIQSLTDEQKTLFESINPQMGKSSEDKMTFKQGDTAVTAMKENMETFIASLSETQKTLYDKLMNKPFRVPGGTKVE